MRNKWNKKLLLNLRGFVFGFVFVLLIATSFKSAIADWNDIPSGSMEPTILIGDRIFVNKLAYDFKVPYTTLHLAKWSDPNRGDIVVFYSPKYGNNYMEKLIPHEFTRGKNHGKAEGPGYLFDLKIDAKGLESQLDELKHRFWKHISEVHERLMDEFDKKSKQRVFILNQSQVGDPSHHFLFTDKEILKRIHLKTFMRCCRAAEQTDHSSLFRKLENEKKLLTKYLDKQYKDIMENFDPKIVRFRKKYKVIFHRDSGLDELLD